MQNGLITFLTVRWQKKFKIFWVTTVCKKSF